MKTGSILLFVLYKALRYSIARILFGLVRILIVSVISLAQEQYLKNADDFKVGDEVKLTNGATYYNGKQPPTWLFNRKLYVRKIQGDMITISIFKTGAITGIVNKNHLVKY